MAKKKSIPEMLYAPISSNNVVGSRAVNFNQAREEFIYDGELKQNYAVYKFSHIEEFSKSDIIIKRKRGTKWLTD